MDAKYRYGHRPGRRRRTRVLIVLSVTLLIAAAIGGVIGYDIYKNRENNTVVEGTTRTVIQSLDDGMDKLSIDEPFFSMELPGDWKEVKRVNNQNENSISWQSTKKQESNRMLTLYVDTIPAKKALNRLLPVTPNGTKLTTGDISDNCALFTQGGTLNATEAQRLPETPAKYKGVDFICNLPRVIDNEVGTGSLEGINSVTLKGSKGEHKYFFLYTERNIQPNYTIFYNAVRSFTAK